MGDPRWDKKLKYKSNNAKSKSGEKLSEPIHDQAAPHSEKNNLNVKQRRLLDLEFGLPSILLRCTVAKISSCLGLFGPDLRSLPPACFCLEFLSR